MQQRRSAGTTMCAAMQSAYGVRTDNGEPRTHYGCFMSGGGGNLLGAQLVTALFIFGAACLLPRSLRTHSCAQAARTSAPAFRLTKHWLITSDHNIWYCSNIKCVRGHSARARAPQHSGSLTTGRD